MADLPFNFTPQKELISGEYWQIIHIKSLDVVNNYLAMGFELIWVNSIPPTSGAYVNAEYILRKKHTKK